MIVAENRMKEYGQIEVRATGSRAAGVTQAAPLLASLMMQIRVNLAILSSYLPLVRVTSCHS